jgi:serine/threonine-protein kinase
LEGLGAAHRKGFLHLDIKPGNIMLQPSPKGAFQVKLIDFGLARLSGGEAHVNAGGEVTGTLQYVPPERLMNKSVDERADLYSLGHVLYEGLCGDPAYADHLSPEQVMISHMTMEAPDVVLLRGDCSGAFGAWLRRMMDRNPANRPASASEALRELMQIQSERTRLQEEVSSLPQEEKSLGRAGWWSRFCENLRVRRPAR